MKYVNRFEKISKIDITKPNLIELFNSNCFPIDDKAKQASLDKKIWQSSVDEAKFIAKMKKNGSILAKKEPLFWSISTFPLSTCTDDQARRHLVTLMEVRHNTDLRHKWEPTFKSSENLHVEKGKTLIFTEVTKSGIPGVSERDMVNKKLSFRTEDGSHYVFVSAVPNQIYEK